MSVIMRLPESITNNMKRQFRPINCICGSSEIVMEETEDRVICLSCVGCGHHGPGSFEADYVSCVLTWNNEVLRFEELLEEY